MIFWFEIKYESILMHALKKKKQILNWAQNKTKPSHGFTLHTDDEAHILYICFIYISSVRQPHYVGQKLYK